MLLKFIATAILSRHNTHSTEGDRKKSKPQNVGDQNICESSDVPGSLGYSLSTISFFCLPPRGVDAEVLTPPSQNGTRSRQERLHSRRKGARGEGWRGCRNGRARADPMQSPLNAGNGDKMSSLYFAAAPARWNMQEASMSFPRSLPLLIRCQDTTMRPRPGTNCGNG